jgi:hypothetical protein
MTARQYWNRRARGMGGTFTTCAEENVLGYPGTADFGEHILVHERKAATNASRENRFTDNPATPRVSMRILEVEIID